MERPDIDAQIAKLRLTWRRVTREWLIARRDVAELQDRTLVDLRSAVAAAQRLEHTERHRADVARQLQALLRPAGTGVSAWADFQGPPPNEPLLHP